MSILPILIAQQKLPSVPLDKNYGFGDQTSLGGFLSGLVMPAFVIASLIVTFYVLIAAIKIITSGGNKDALSSARGMITHGLIGLVLLMLMFVILKFIPEFFQLGGFQIIK